MQYSFLKLSYFSYSISLIEKKYFYAPSAHFLQLADMMIPNGYQKMTHLFKCILTTGYSPSIICIISHLLKRNLKTYYFRFAGVQIHTGKPF